MSEHSKARYEELMNAIDRLSADLAIEPPPNPSDSNVKVDPISYGIYPDNIRVKWRLVRALALEFNENIQNEIRKEISLTRNYSRT